MRVSEIVEVTRRFDVQECGGIKLVPPRNKMKVICSNFFRSKLTVVFLNSQIVLFFLRNADVQCKSGSGQTALDLANEEVCKFLKPYYEREEENVRVPFD